MLENKIEYGLHFLGYFDDEPERFPEIQHLILGTVEQGKNFAIEHEVDEIFCALPNKQEEKIRDLIAFADEQLIRLKIVPDFSHFLTNQFHKIEIDYYGTFPVMTPRNEPLDNILILNIL